MNLHEEISRVAYELYEKSGRVPGRDEENWFEAERIVLAREKGAGKKAPRKAARAPRTAPKRSRSKRP